jgi:hypothetical protein
MQCPPVQGGLAKENLSQTHLEYIGNKNTSSCSSATSTFVLSCFYCNAQSLKNKISDLHDVLYSYEHNIIAFSETWLILDLSDGILDPRGHYNIFRKDRNFKAGGGVCIFVLIDSCIQFNLLHYNQSLFPQVELIGCEVHVSTVKLIVLCVYIAPNVSKITFMNYIECMKSLLTRNTNVPFLIVGDFNLPSILWSNPTSHLNTKECEFVNLCQNFGLLQVNDLCTRGNSLLDLVLTNDPLLISGIKLNPPFGTSDHDSLLVDIILCFISESACTNNGVNNTDNVHLNRATAYNWIKADWEGCAQFCSNICWPELLKNCFSSNELWQTFSLALQNGLDIFVPQKTISMNGGRKNCKKKHPKNIKKLLRRKKTIWKASKKILL